MRINNNVMAMFSYRYYNNALGRLAKSSQRLSSGYRINSAADDPAGLAISEKMRAQIRGLSMASKNAQDAISMIQTAEGSLAETHNILRRLKELAVQAGSDTNNDNVDREALNAEFQQLLAEIDDTARTTRFNDSNLIDGTYAKDQNKNLGQYSWRGKNATSLRVEANATIADGKYSMTATDFDAATNKIKFALLDTNNAVVGNEVEISLDDITGDTFEVDFGNGVHVSMKKFSADDCANLDAAKDFAGGTTFEVVTKGGGGHTIQTGANQGDTMEINIDRMDVDSLGLRDVNVLTGDAARSAISSVDEAINRVSKQRAELGAKQNRLNHKINNLENSIINLQDAESRIRDVDMAKEMSEYVKAQIQMQASMAMLAQANSMPQMVLQLLQV